MKEGRMRDAKPIGVLLGHHEHGIGSVPLHKEHHVCISSFKTSETPAGTPSKSSRLRSAAQRSGRGMVNRVSGKDITLS
eukprot:219777-Pleurochrysis_carterae.AAC.1